MAALLVETVAGQVLLASSQNFVLTIYKKAEYLRVNFTWRAYAATQGRPACKLPTCTHPSGLQISLHHSEGRNRFQHAGSKSTGPSPTLLSPASTTPSAGRTFSSSHPRPFDSLNLLRFPYPNTRPQRGRLEPGPGLDTPFPLGLQRPAGGGLSTWSGSSSRSLGRGVQRAWSPLPTVLACLAPPSPRMPEKT